MLRLCAGSELRVLASIECAKQRIRLIIAGSHVPEDPCHADNTVEWLLRLEPDASETLQLAALAHDIDRAVERSKIRRADFGNYDAFKAAHARNSAEILRLILTACGVERDIAEEACRLVELHEVGAIPALICSKMQTAFPISMSTCCHISSVKVGTRPSGDHSGVTAGLPQEHKRSSNTSTTRTRDWRVCCER